MVTARVMLINVVFGEEETFCLFDGCVNLDPTLSWGHSDAVTSKSTVDQPGADGIDRFVAGGESGGDLNRGQCLPKLGEVGSETSLR